MKNLFIYIKSLYNLFFHLTIFVQRPFRKKISSGKLPSPSSEKQLNSIIEKYSFIEEEVKIKLFAEKAKDFL